MAKSMTVKEAGRKGGLARTPKKAAAVRENGKKGGFPRQTEHQLAASNAALEHLFSEIKKCAKICALNDAPLRGITYRVLDNDETRTHITYRLK